MKTSITLFILSGILAYIGSEVVVSQGMQVWFVVASVLTGMACLVTTLDSFVNRERIIRIEQAETYHS